MWKFVVLVACSVATITTTAVTDVHIVAHTHDDVGWILTPTGYFNTEVINIINHVVKSLDAVPARRFVYVEVYYFQRWWTTVATPTQQDTVRPPI